MTTPNYTLCHIRPEGYDGLACQCVIPDGWTRVPLPVEEVDLSNPMVFVPLLIASAPYAAVVVTIAARPAFDSGSVEDWARYLSEQNNLSIENMREWRIGRMPCVLSNATMDSDAGLMRSRSAFLEDGGRLFNIGVLAPEAIWSSLESTLQHVLESFALEDVQGISAVLMREMREQPNVDTDVQ